MHPSVSHKARPLEERIAILRSEAGRSTSAQNLRCRKITDRAMRWHAQFPFSDEKLFAQRLAAANITEDEFLHVLNEEIDPCDKEPSEWLQTLDEIYSSSKLSTSQFVDAAQYSSQVLSPFLRSVEPIIDYYATRLIHDAIEIGHEHDIIPFEPEAVPHLFIGDLLGAFQRMLAPTMLLQLNLARLQHHLSGDSSAERFENFLARLGDRNFIMRIFREFPVLAQQIVRHGEQWLGNSVLFLRHLSRDWPAIRATFSPLSDPGPLVGIKAKLGDSHRGGRSVQMAVFSSGLHIVYKPRSLAVDLHFQELLEWVNNRVGDVTLRPLTVLDRESHGWMEYVVASDCPSRDVVHRFYERQGGYLALFYLLAGSDLHCDNVIASGEHPVVVDLETLFHPRIGTPSLQGIAAESLAVSVLGSGLLPVPMRVGEEAQQFDRSGLGASQSEMSPFALLCPEESGTDEMRLVRKHLPIRPSAHWPTVDGQPVEQIDGEAIVRGFAKFYHAFLAHKKDLLEKNGPIARFLNDEVRIVLRNTVIYSRILSESFHPDVLRDALDRDQMFDLLWGSVPDSSHLSRVVTAECRDLWNGDVPLFTGRVGSRDLFTSTGECIPDFLSEPSDSVVHRRIEGLNTTDLERQVWLIRASLMTLASGRVRMSRHSPGAFRDGHAGSDPARLIAQARSIGDRLETLSVRSETEADWIDLKNQGRYGWSVRPLGPELYEGTAGIVLFLAYLAAITQEERYQRLAQVGATRLKHQVMNLKGIKREIGGFSGWGGLIYVYGHLAVLWNSAEFIDGARSMIDDLVPLIEEDRHYDIIGGAAGCIGSLLAIHRIQPSDALLSVAVRCGDHLVRSARPAECGLGWSSYVYDMPLAGFSHGVAGIAWALLELTRLSGDARFRQTAMAALEYERSLFNEEIGNWADLRPHDESHTAVKSPMAAWCHGAAGIGLSRLYMLAGGSCELAHRELVAAVETTLVSGFGYNHSLCHGDLGNLDFILQASEAPGNSIWRADVLRLTGKVLDEIEHNGFKCGIGKPVETPGLMTGLAGIGYGLLRLAEPQRVPSALVLSPPANGL
jgi:type 2 lantibiotic biosynthesis protein LanM